ncbi:alpha-glucuronidase family glycosyl hydrolase [Pollutibacter soli]|uniref:alpha-glucuronidase family glycosyl hydrolase n=1 Tax=Pollutibacter soli TaxID=3034157 RepID=UPI003013F3A8
MKKAKLFFILTLLISVSVSAETGYDLWLRYNLVPNKRKLEEYRKVLSSIIVNGSSSTIVAAQAELLNGLSGLLGKKITISGSNTTVGDLIIGTNGIQPEIKSLLKADLAQLGSEGFLIKTIVRSGKNCIVITANEDAGVLYGSFHLLRLIQTGQPINNLNIVSAPKLKLRLLNHWDNLNRTVERGYAGFSIWNWHKLPTYMDKRYVDYARATASIGINGTVLTNVNANATVLTNPYLEKVAALANLFRTYGIKVYLTARFSAPVELGGLKTADPLDPEVQRWWKEKVDEIYKHVPDFGGFLVKANSEGQPGPQNYKRTHADGANMLADAVAPHGGIVMWRAFVYSDEVPEDRHKQAYNEFVPLDGKFRKNVLVQVKNGAIDFMPREPFHPLFGAMPQTQTMMEFQVTQEYLGQATTLVFLAPLFKEVLDSDTWRNGKGSTVGKIINGASQQQQLTGMAGVANIGNDFNWCGHPFAQANWYALGRLSWDASISSEQIADEWIRMTFSEEPKFLEPVKKIMLESREMYTQYTMPMGLHHLITYGSHYGPAPWVDKGQRPDWTNVYYHKADSIGLGFNRTSTGSNALGQYATEVQQQWGDPNTCDEKYLLWFHHVPWTFKLKSGRTLWDELCYDYYTGANRVKSLQEKWNLLKPFVDKERFEEVKMLLQIQYDEAIWWRNSCVLYFQTFSKMPIPAGYEKPDKTLEYYKSLKFPYAP